MALQFSTTGLDLSPLAEGVAKGLAIKAENDRYENKILHQDFQDFNRTFNPSKINEEQDAKKFADATFDWKESKKAVLKASQGGLFHRANADKVNELETKANNDYSKAVGIYAKRVDINQNILAYSKAIDENTRQKRVTPKEMYDQLNFLRTHSGDEIDLSKIPEPSSFDINPSLAEISNFAKALKDTKVVATNVGSENIGEPIVVGQGVLGDNKKGLVLNKVAEYNYAKPNQLYNYAKLQERTPLENNFTSNFEQFQSALQSQDPRISIPAKDKLEKITSSFNIDPASVDKWHLSVIDNGGLDKVYTKPPKYDSTAINMAFKTASALSAAERMKISQGFLQASISKNANDKEQAKQLRLYSMLINPNTEALMKDSKKFEETFSGIVPDSKKYYKDLNQIMNKGKVSMLEAANLIAEGKDVTSSKSD